MLETWKASLTAPFLLHTTFWTQQGSLDSTQDSPIYPLGIPLTPSLGLHTQDLPSRPKVFSHLPPVHLPEE